MARAERRPRKLRSSCIGSEVRLLALFLLFLIIVLATLDYAVGEYEYIPEEDAIIGPDVGDGSSDTEHLNTEQLNTEYSTGDDSQLSQPAEDTHDVYGTAEAAPEEVNLNPHRAYEGQEFDHPHPSVDDSSDGMEYDEDYYYDDYDDDDDDDEELWEQDHLHPHHHLPHDPHDRHNIPSGAKKHSFGPASREHTGQGLASKNGEEPTANRHEMHQKEHHKSHLKSPASHPPYAHWERLHDRLSDAHALLCLVMYVGLTLKILRDNMSLGISPQTVCALFVSEFASFIVRVSFIRKDSKFDWSVIYTDFASVLGSCICLILVWYKFRRSTLSHKTDIQCDAFGMNVISCVYFIIRSLPFCPGSSASAENVHFAVGADDRDDLSGSNRSNYKSNKKRIIMLWTVPDGEHKVVEISWGVMRKYGMHFGHLQPRGLLGRIAARIYWLVLYLCVAFPVTILLLSVKTYVGVTAASWTWKVVTFSDAVRSVALLPQLYMFETRKTKRISEQLLFYVICEVLLKLFAILFWVTYPLVHYTSPVTRVNQLYAIIVHLLHLLIVVRVLALFCKSRQGAEAVIEKAIEMSIPMTSDSRMKSGTASTTKSRVGVQSSAASYYR